MSKSKAALSGKYAAYPEYKDSGVEWLGEIPSHWKVKKIKHFGRVLGGFAFKSGDFIKQGYPVIKITNVSHLVMSFNEQAYLPEKFAHENAEYIAQPNSLIFAMTRPIIAGGIKVAKMPKLKKMPLINQRVGFLKIEDKNITDFILFSSLSNSFIAQFKNNMTITNQPNISSEGIESVSLPFPSKNELEKIVTFLDHETAKIDTLIEKQQRLIELLKEKRQAVISHAVTKGLNPDTPMKDSGVEWLGEVPEHWDVKKIKHFGRVVGGFAFKSGDFIEQGYPVIKITNVSHLTMSFNEQAYLPEKFANENSEYIAPPNSLVFAMTRPIIAGGIKVAKMPKLEKMPLINQRVGLLKIEDETLTDYILFSSLSNSFVAQFKNNMTITNQPNISSEGIESVSFPFPPKNELKQITAYLTNNEKRFDSLIKKGKEQVNLLTERRTALISAAVTGKIDVRNWVAPTTSSDENEAAQEVMA